MAALYGGRRTVLGAPFETRGPLVGREHELEIAGDLRVERGVRLLTLTGPPGVGKTTLALAIADDLLEELADGAIFVALSTTDPDQ